MARPDMGVPAHISSYHHYLCINTSHCAAVLPHCHTNLRNTLTTDTDTAAGRRVVAAECSEVAGAELIILLKIFSHFLPARRQHEHQR